MLLQLGGGSPGAVVAQPLSLPTEESQRCQTPPLQGQRHCAHI